MSIPLGAESRVDPPLIAAAIKGQVNRAPAAADVAPAPDLSAPAIAHSRV